MNACERIKESGVELYCIGVGPDVLAEDMRQWCSFPANMHYFMVARQEQRCCARLN